MKNIKLENGTTIVLPAVFDELTKVKVIDKDGNTKEEIWGTVISATNGEVLTLL